MLAFVIASLVVVSTPATAGLGPAALDDLLPDGPTVGFEHTTHADTMSPRIYIFKSHSHPEGQWTNRGVADIEVYVADRVQNGAEASGVDGLAWVLDEFGGTLDPGCKVTQTLEEGRNHVFVPLEPFGQFIYRVRVVDHAGNCSQETYELELLVDTIPPVVTSINPDRGEVVNAGTRKVEIRFNDKDLDAQKTPQDENELRTSVEVSSLRLFVDGVDRTFYTARTQGSLDYVSPLGFTLGTHVLEFWMSDTTYRADTVRKFWSFTVVAQSGLDKDGDLIVDDLESKICEDGSPEAGLGGSCVEGDYRPPYDLAGLIIHESSKVVALVDDNVRVGVHFN